MHDCGVLGRMFPPFQAITCRVVRDFFHKYTVDEHTLLTIKNLERLATRASPDRERFSSLLQDLEAPELLVLSLLFHDVGKWRDEDHASESVRMAREMFERLGLAPEARATVEFLIANHLAMSQVAFRRDTEDPEIVRTFAGLVGVEERLKMLCLMTLADVEAVSLETLTPWRAELLWRLFVDTYNHLTLGYGDELIEPNQPADTELLANRPSRFDGAATSRISWPGCRDATCSSSSATPSTATFGCRATSIRTKCICGSSRKERRWELTVVTLDKPFLFSNISGRAVVVRHGHPARPRDDQPERPGARRVPVHRPGRFLELNANARDQMFQVLDEVVSGRASVTARLRGREDSLFHRRPPRVDAGRSLRQSVLPTVYDSRYHCRRRARPALPDQPGHLPERLRNRSRADCHGGSPGHRRVSHHQGGRRSCPTRISPSWRRTYSGCWRGVMKLIKSIVRPNKVDEVKDALEKIGISGMTVTEVRGHGKQKGHTAIYRGKEYNVSLLPKMQIEVVVADSVVDDAIKAIITSAKTGEIGDGRVFVLPVEQTYRIRTGERDSF